MLVEAILYSLKERNTYKEFFLYSLYKVLLMDNSVLTDNAYHFILNKILNGEIAPGERLREDTLAEQLGMSRTPVREAVRQLSQDGFIVNIKRKGLYCVEISEKDLLNLLDLRMVLRSEERRVGKECS